MAINRAQLVKELVQACMLSLDLSMTGMPMSTRISSIRKTRNERMKKKSCLLALVKPQ